MIFIEDGTKGNLAGNELKKYRQKKKILNLLYKHETLSGSSIGGRIGVSLPTALSLINELTKLKLIESCGTGVSKGGRKPNMFRLANDSVFVVACELDQYQGKLTIYNSHNQRVTPIVYFETSIDDQKLIDKIYEKTQKLIEENSLNEKRVYAIGLTMRGLVDEVEGINYTIKNPKFRNVKERLENKFPYLVYVNNDARMQAYGEYVFGKAKGYSNAIIANWSWGIGLGLILDGKLYNGSSGFAGEFSHIKVVEDGELCECGKRGCLQTIAASGVLIKNAVEEIESGAVTQLSRAFKDRIHDLQPEDIVKAAKMGDEFSISLLNNVGLALGKGLSVTIQLLNPDVIVLGGVISKAERFVLSPIYQSIYRHCLEQISSNVKIVISEDWEQSGLLGVTAILFQKLFSDLQSKNKYEFV